MAARNKARGPKSEAVVRKLAMALPGMEEGTSYGTTAFRVRKKLLGRMLDDPDLFVVKIDMEQRDAWMEADPHAFFITDHYRGYPMMIVRVSAVDPGDLSDLIEDAWRRAAPKSLIASFDGDA
jgi:hypothetical protein